MKHLCGSDVWDIFRTKTRFPLKNVSALCVGRTNEKWSSQIVTEGVVVTFLWSCSVGSLGTAISPNYNNTKKPVVSIAKKSKSSCVGDFPYVFTTHDTSSQARASFCFVGEENHFLAPESVFLTNGEFLAFQMLGK